MMCPDENQLARLADGPIPQAELAALEVHLDACTVCSTLITELGALSIGDYPELLPIAPEHYLVGKQLARGGMGKIFTARDRRHGRLVAIKELLASSPASRARFEREARITAKLQHPSIVNFIEAGVWPTGEPFYVMKLIDGESLDKAIARRTTLDARLALLPHVIDVVDALAYAHSIRVIHRDLKPSNVLVGNFGETVVLDWGLAKDLSDTMDSDVVIGPFRPSSPSTEATVAGTVIGTPAYMPPEQARGERVDERADVYALGALLYHVLAGAPPYEGSNATEIVQHVINARPRSLGERSLGVPRELITIVETAMAASPDDRFPTASQLAEDLKKFQTGQLVGAHHYSRWQLLGRWTRRHRVAVAVGAVAAALLVALGVFSLNGIANERERTETQRRVAIANQRDAEELMTFMVGDLSRKLEPLGQLDLLESVATKAVSYFERRPEGSLQDRHRQCLALQSAADVLLAKGDSNGALAASRAMLAIADSLVAEDPGTPRWQADLWFAHDGIGDVLARQGKLAEAMQHHQISLATMSRLAQREPNNLDHPFHLVATRTRIGNVFAAQGEPDKALPEYRIALQLAETLVTREPSNASHQSSLARAHVHVGDVLGTQGDTGQALTHYRASLSIAEQLVRKEPDNTAHRRHLAGSHSSVATMLKLRGDATEALNHYRAAMTIANALADKDPANADWQRDVAVSHTEIGELLAATGDGKGAIREWRA
ncbi:MAG: protein kinase, partial [Kofleriaceae bacterium]